MYNLKKIKKKINIASVIKKYIKLYGEKGKFFGLCPFHQEKNPSFHVRSDKGYFKCFGCGEKGDVFSFIKKYKKITFQNSLIYLKIKKKQYSKNYISLIKENNEFIHVLEHVKEYFSQNLFSINGKIALKYLKKNRGLNNLDIKKFKIGLADSSKKNLYTHLKKKHIKLNFLEKLGLIKNGKYGKYSFFSNRITFPIYDTQKKCIAFVGRIFKNNSSKMKYINSPNNSIYNKSKNLYQSANKILLQKNIILTEGCFDLIAITKAGFESIAICGSSFHLKSIRNIIFKKNIIMCLDNDNAGLLASKKILYKLLSIGITPNISILSKKDPASFMQNNNIKLLNLEINKNTDALTYFIKNINTNLINNKKQKEEIINEFSIYIKAHPRNLIKIKYCKILAFKLKEDKNLLEKKILNIESKKNIHFFCTDVEKKNQYKYFEKMLLGYFAKNYKYLKHFSEKYLNYLKVIQKNIFLKLKLIENNNKKEIFNIYKKEKILNNPLMRNILIIKNTNQFIKNSYLNIIKSIKINLKKQKKNKKINKNIYAINLAYNEGDKKLAILLQKKIKKN